MNEVENNNKLSQKITILIKNNLNTIVIILVSLAYIFYGMLSLDKTGKTFIEIIGGGLLSTITGITIKTLRMNTAIAEGLESQIFLLKLNAYGKKKSEIAPYIDELGNFCLYKNTERLKQAQSIFLLKYAMKYDLFIKGYYDKDPTKEKILEECRKISIFEYTPVMLTNAYDNFSSEEEILSSSILKFQKRSNFQRVILAVLCGLLFGYYTLGKNFEWSNVAWATFQIALYLIMGQLDYNKGYYFITQTLRGKIERIITILDEFQSLRIQHEGIFKVKFEEEENIKEDIKIESKEEIQNEQQLQQ